MSTMGYSNTGCLNSIILAHWLDLDHHLRKDTSIRIQSSTTNFAAVIAVSRYSRSIGIDDSIWEPVERSVEVIRKALQKETVIYGINTGFGANADTRTTQHEALQRSLIRALNYGVVTGIASNQTTSLLEKPRTRSVPSRMSPELPNVVHAEALALGHQHDTLMPESWVRAMVLIRAISLSKGASGVRPHVIKNIVTLLNSNMVPVVPLRGSISASGDLSPLSYLGGVLQGKAAMRVMSRPVGSSEPVFISAVEALKRANIEALTIAPKEGLAIVNGTAASTGVACLAMHEMLQLSILAQILTGSTLEALCGSKEAFSSFLSEIRPHKGQTEAANNILAFVSGSKLTSNFEESDGVSRQERYATRTAPQWLGPSLEDVRLAYEQVKIEIDAVTDNPVIQSSTGKFFHGGNFQARSITSAMDKTRLACQTIGQMLFAQCTEIINPVTSHGLPSNLVVDEPNVSFIHKGTDIFIAALQSELGYLANPVTHVQFAEQGNQAINSLALISARYTMSALDVLSQMMAAHIVALCQAFDLRVMQIMFIQSFEPHFRRLTSELLQQITQETIDKESIVTSLWKVFIKPNASYCHMPSKQRFDEVIGGLLSNLLLQVSFDSPHAASKSLLWKQECVQSAVAIYQETRDSALGSINTPDYLGLASKEIYLFVRDRLGVPFSGEDYLNAAEMSDPENTTSWKDSKSSCHQTVGEMITAVYVAIRSGSLFAELVPMLFKAMENESASADKLHLRSKL